MLIQGDMNDFIIELSLPEEFNFAQCLTYMARSSLESLYQVNEDSVLRFLNVGAKQLLIRLSQPSDRRMRVTVLYGGPLGPLEQNNLSAYIRHWFDLDTDLRPFYRMTDNDSLLGLLTKRFYGLRLIGIPDLFEALCWAILGQQVNLTFAYTLKKRMTETYGESIEWEGKVLYCFPAPERIATLTVEQLSELQLTKNKARAILGVAAAMEREELSLTQLLQMKDMTLVDAALTSMHGIGPWTSQYVRMRCLRDPSVFLPADVGLQNAVKLLMDMSQTPTVVELQTLFEKWQGWEAYANFYMWRALY